MIAQVAEKEAARLSVYFLLSVDWALHPISRTPGGKPGGFVGILDRRCRQCGRRLAALGLRLR